jgi:hypothetical protein
MYITYTSDSVLVSGTPNNSISQLAPFNIKYFPHFNQCPKFKMESKQVI